MEGECENFTYGGVVNRSVIFGVSSLNADYDTAYIIRGWLSCFICGFGLVGNLLSTVVLTRPALRILPINVILLFLTLCDSIYILLYLISWSIPTIMARHAMEEGDTVKMENYFMTNWRPHFYPYLYPMLWTAQNASTGLTIFLTVERYIYVCKPMDSNKYISRKKTIMIALMILIGYILYELPLWWRFETAKYTEEIPPPGCDYIPIYIIKKREDLLETPFMKAYLSKFKILFLHYLFPLIILFILNWNITSALKSIEKRRRRITRSEARNISYTKIVICVISLSCITDLVFSVVTIVGYLRDLEHDLHSLYVLMKDIVDLLNLTNSSVNFIFYCLLGTAFKQEFLTLFCPFYSRKSTLSEISESQGPDSLRRRSQNK